MKVMPIYRDTLDAMNRLSYEERGRLFTAMMAYFFNDEQPEMIATGKEELLLDLMISRLDASKDNARKMFENRSNGRKNMSKQTEQMISNDINSYQNNQMISNCSNESIDENDVNSAYNKNKDKNKNKDENKKNNTPKGDIKAILAESGLTDPVLNTLEDFIKMRKSIKKPMTDYAIKLLISKLKKLSTDEDTQIEILNQSILHSWQDVYALKDSGAGHYTHSRDKPYNAATDYEQRDYSDDDLNKYFIDLSSVKGSDTG